MGLQKRITFVATVVIVIVSIGIGAFAILNSYRIQFGQVDARLAANVVAVQSAEENSLSTALVLVSQTDIPVALGYVAANGDLTLVKENGLSIPLSPTFAELKTATKTSVSLTSDPSIFIRSVPLNDKGYVFFAADIQDILDQRNQQIQFLTIVILGSVFVAFLSVNRLIRRDIRKIENLASRAALIADGDLSVQLPAREGNSEVDELTEAMGSMVEHLTRLIEQEKATHRAMQDFLSDASHELRTPLTVVKGYTEILQHLPESQSEQEQRAFQRIASEIERMNQLVEDLLLLAELGEPQAVAFEPVDVSQMLLDAVEDLQSMQLNRSIVHTIDSPVFIQGSSRLIGQLFANLIGNINRHTPPEASVQISLAQTHDSVQIQFDDAGPGLPDIAYENQTQHFRRFDKSRSRKTGGFGLGMSIMQAVVNQHHGTLVLGRSDLGGLRTTITLPKEVA